MRYLSLLFFVLFSFPFNALAQDSYQDGMSWKAKGNYVEALKHFEKAKEANPNDRKVLNEYANAAFNARKYVKALPVYEELIKDDKKNLRYLIRLAKMYSYSSKKHLSATYADQALKLKPSNPDDIFTLAEVFYFIKHYPKALSLYEKISELNAKALTRAAKTNNKLHNYPAAIKAYEQLILKEDPSVNSTTYYELANALYNNNQFVKAVIVYDKALELGFYNAGMIHQNKAQSFMAMNKFDDAISSFLVASQSDPYNKNLNLNIIDCYIRAERFSDARKMMDDLMISMPNDAELTYSYGMSYYKEGKTTKADKFFNQAFVLNPSLKSLRYTKHNF